MNKYMQYITINDGSVVGYAIQKDKYVYLQVELYKINPSIYTYILWDSKMCWVDELIV